MPFISGLASGIDTDQIISQLMAIERRPVLLMQGQKNSLQLKLDAYRDVNTRLTNFLAKLDSLTQLSTFQSKSVTSSNELVAIATADPEATPSIYNLVIDQLARTHRLSSDEQTDTTTALGLSGTVQINDVNVDISTGMSLSGVRDAINEAGAGVNASILNNTLILESEETGAINSIQLVDSTGTSSESITSTDGSVVSGTITGEVTSATYDVTVNQLAAVHQVKSDEFTSKTTALNIEGTFTINGVEVDVASSNTLEGIRDKINAADTGVTASVQTTAGNNYELVLTSNEAGFSNEMTGTDVSGTPLTDLGILQTPSGGFNHVVQDGEDAEFVIDGQSYSRETNTVDDIISGVTLSLNSPTGTTEQIEVARDFTTGGVFNSLGLLDDNGYLKNELQTAQDAKLSVNGVALTRSSNEANDAVQGVTFDLQSVGDATISIGRDVQNAMDQINAFVAQYNSVQDFILSVTDKEAVLQGDSTLIRLQSKIHNRATDLVGVPTDFDYDSLSIIGIRVDRDGKMTVDDGVLRTALENNPDQVQDLFSATTEDEGYEGVAVRLESFVEIYTQSNTGIIDTREEMFRNRMDSLQESMDRFEDRLNLREQRLIRKFTEMEKVLASLQTLGGALAGQIAQLGSFGSN